MTAPAPVTVILPHFCQQEVNRYLKIANHLRTLAQPENGYRFLLAVSPKMPMSQSLVDAYRPLGETIEFSCPTPVFGYPQGPTAMFWDCMDFLAENFGNQNGFAVWMESDMVPTQPDWIDRLAAEWYQGSTEGVPTPIMMGCYVPEVYKHRILKKPKLLLQPHINGGACYSLDFALQMPIEARSGVFDMAVFQYAQRIGRARFTRQIAFSTTHRVRRDLMDNQKVLIHGFMQDKDQFIDASVRPVTEREKLLASWNPMLEWWENVQRQVRVNFVRNGHRAMLENMFLAKRKFESQIVTEPPPTT